MPSKREDVSTSGAATDKDLGFTHTELVDAWQSLYDSLPPPIDKATDRYVSQLVDEWHMDRHTVVDLLKEWEGEGKVTKVGKRRLENGRSVECWKVV